MNRNNDSKEIVKLEHENELDTPKDKDSQLIEAYLDCLDVREAGRRVYQNLW